MTDTLNNLPPLQEWLGRNLTEITEIVEFTKIHLDPSPEQLNAMGAEINQKAAVVGYLLADARCYLVSEKAAAVREMTELDELGPTAQKALIESRVRDLKRLCENLAVAKGALKSLSIAVCSIRKSRG